MEIKYLSNPALVQNAARNNDVDCMIVIGRAGAFLGLFPRF